MILTPRFPARIDPARGGAGGRWGSAALALLIALFATASADGQTVPATSDATFVRGGRLAARYSGWSIESPDSTVTLRQFILPAEIHLLPDPRLRMRLGIDLRSQSLSDPGEISSAGVAGGWVDARYDVVPRWLLGAGLTAPFSDPALTMKESRIVSWLEETGLQMPGGGLALEPSVEGRVTHTLAAGGGLAAAGVLALRVRLPYTAFEGESDLDPGDRLRLALAIEGPLAGWRAAATVAGRVESVTRLGGSDRYREGACGQMDVVLVRPGNHKWEGWFRSYVQAKGDGAGGWPAPSAGTLLSLGVERSGGMIWQWSLGLSAWTSRGFDDRIGDLHALRPMLSLGRSLGRQRLEGRIAPSFGTASGNQSLRGVDLTLNWSLRP